MTRPGEMRLSELRPCDHCGGPVAPIFYVVDVQVAVVDAQAANATLGLHQMFGGRALGLAEAMSPGGEVKLGGAELTTRLFICSTCHVDILGQALEGVADAARRKGGAG